MARCSKLFAAFKASPKNQRFADLCKLLECFGYFHDRDRGSHKIYVHPRREVPIMNVQPTKNGQAKPYQVKQLMQAAEAHGLELES
jgi:predicted RNA binding protein YcfA (HicA-like mRNA interferase family)